MAATPGGLGRWRLPRLLRRGWHLVGGQQRRRRAHRRDAGRTEQEDPGALAGDAVMHGDRAALGLVPDEQDQVPRPERFRTAHPEVVILLRRPRPRAWVGSRKIERSTLRALLDELEEIFPHAAQDRQAGSTQ